MNVNCGVGNRMFWHVGPLRYVLKRLPAVSKKMPSKVLDSTFHRLGRLICKFAVKWSLKIASRLKQITTVWSCENNVFRRLHTAVQGLAASSNVENYSGLDDQSIVIVLVEYFNATQMCSYTTLWFIVNHNIRIIYINADMLLIYRRVCYWKNFENWFGKLSPESPMILWASAHHDELLARICEM